MIKKFISRANNRNAFYSLVVSTLLVSEVAQAATQFSGSGSFQKSNLGLEAQTSTMGKAAISTDFLTYFRLGYSFAKVFQYRKGYIDEAPEFSEEHYYVSFEQKVTQTINSADLFIVLYAGEIFTPYIFGGVAYKQFEIQGKKDGQELKTKKGSGLGPNYGVGTAINLSRSFALKISQTWSDGQIDRLDGTSEKAVDSQLEVGITYSWQ